MFCVPGTVLGAGMQQWTRLHLSPHSAFLIETNKSIDLLLPLFFITSASSEQLIFSSFSYMSSIWESDLNAPSHLILKVLSGTYCYCPQLSKEKDKTMRN